MKIEIVGGGPAGLYFAILMKRLSPAHQVTIHERNRADDTFGWGVVFSDETLSNFEEADPETHGAITSRFAYWTDIDVFFRGQRIRSTGHGFAGISRHEFLHILQDRAAALGAELQRLLDCPERVHEYRRLAAERAQTQPDWDEIARRTEELYYRLLGREDVSSPRRHVTLAGGLGGR